MQSEITPEEQLRREQQSRRDRNRHKRAKRKAAHNAPPENDYETEADYIVDRMQFPFR